jgi:L-methionine (R)-S-oxide reductase
MSFKYTAGVNLSKEETYKRLIPQIVSLIENEKNLVANASNITSVLKQAFRNFIWTGFYFYDKEAGNLVLGPFQGKVGCTRIEIGKGVCGTAASQKKTIVVGDVNQFPGHRFCDTDSKSEIVVPVLKNGELKAVLDIDSGVYNCFDDTDKMYLEELVSKILNIF